MKHATLTHAHCSGGDASTHTFRVHQSTLSVSRINLIFVVCSMFGRPKRHKMRCHSTFVASTLYATFQCSNSNYYDISLFAFVVSAVVVVCSHFSFSFGCCATVRRSENRQWLTEKLWCINFILTRSNDIFQEPTNLQRLEGKCMCVRNAYVFDVPMKRPKHQFS